MLVPLCELKGALGSFQRSVYKDLPVLLYIFSAVSILFIKSVFYKTIVDVDVLSSSCMAYTTSTQGARQFLNAR